MEEMAFVELLGFFTSCWKKKCLLTLLSPFKHSLHLCSESHFWCEFNIPPLCVADSGWQLAQDTVLFSYSGHQSASGCSSSYTSSSQTRTAALHRKWLGVLPLSFVSWFLCISAGLLRSECESNEWGKIALKLKNRFKHCWLKNLRKKEKWHLKTKKKKEKTTIFLKYLNLFLILVGAFLHNFLELNIWAWNFSGPLVFLTICMTALQKSTLRKAGDIQYHGAILANAPKCAIAISEKWTMPQYNKSSFSRFYSSPLWTHTS